MINGEERAAPALGTVVDLARWLELPAFGSAVELNGQVVRKPDYGTTRVQDGDCLEVIRLVGGG
ncbi:MAG: sulfur carrier protein ThiS [Holophaga sp.]